MFFTDLGNTGKIVWERGNEFCFGNTEFEVPEQVFPQVVVFEVHSMRLEMAHRTHLTLLSKDTSDPPLSSLFSFDPSVQNSKFTCLTDAVLMCVIRILPLASHPSLIFHLHVDCSGTSLYRDNIVSSYLFAFQCLKNFST